MPVDLTGCSQYALALRSLLYAVLVHAQSEAAPAPVRGLCLVWLEKTLAAYCKKRGYDGVICGHIHHAEIKDIDGIKYMNDGDWVESLTALVEHHDGQWEIVTWTQETDNVVDDIDSSTHNEPARSTRKNRTSVQRSKDLRTSTSDYAI